MDNDLNSEMQSYSNDLTLNSTDGDVKGEYGYDETVKNLKAQVEKLEIIALSYWLMMKNKGFSGTEFDDAVMNSMELLKRKDFKIQGIRCPGCGKNAQTSGFFKIKCIYCGMEAVINPYEIYEMMPSAPQPEEQPAIQEEPYGGYRYQPKEEEEAYDINKDLRFDDLM